MMSVIVEILIWVSLLLIVGFLIGGIRYHYLKKNKNYKYTNDFVSFSRFSASRILDKDTFAMLRDLEYSKQM